MDFSKGEESEVESQVKALADSGVQVRKSLFSSIWVILLRLSLLPESSEISIFTSLTNIRLWLLGKLPPNYQLFKYAFKTYF